MIKYTIEQLRIFRDIKLSNDYDKNDAYDDIHTNDYDNFSNETDEFLDWLEKNEKKGVVRFYLDGSENITKIITHDKNRIL